MDLRWLSDMTPDAQETSSDAEEAEQDAMHVIEEDYGSNYDDPTRGLGIASISSQAMLTSTRSWEQKAVTELQKDDRFSTVTAKIETSDDGSVWMHIDVDEDGNVIDVTVPIPTAGGSST